jgi:aminomethyltransferase
MLIFDLVRTFSQIRVRGKHRVDFLQRMSTGDLLNMRPGEGRTTVFTTPIGRMVDYAVVLAFEDSLLMLSGGSGQGKLVRWLRKYILYEDDVQLIDESTNSILLGVFGDDAPALVEGLLPGGAEIPLYAHRSFGAGVVAGAPPLEGVGYYLRGRLPPLAAPRPISQYEDMRIHAGYPAFPNEINEEYIPLEAGLLNAVSFSKGCYIGQEIIARMESRQQLAKRLVGLSSDATLKRGDELRDAAGQGLVGVVTSATTDGHEALGYVRSALAQPGQTLAANGAPVTVTGLVSV